METNNTHGVPVNTKSLLAFIFNQMSRLNSGEIDWQTANAQAKLASQASNLLIVQLRLREIGGGLQATEPQLREIEGKDFDSTI